MFDIGFLEILIILIITLLVIGPERMPEVARKIGSFTGKMRRFVNQMKEDSPLQDTVREVQDAMNLEEEKRHIEDIGKDLETGLGQTSSDMDMDFEEFNRPFGGDSTQNGSSQFNKAPSQPQMPAAEDKAKSADVAPSTNSTTPATDETPAVNENSVPETAAPSKSEPATQSETQKS